MVLPAPNTNLPSTSCHAEPSSRCKGYQMSRNTWFRAEFERARQFNQALPPHARLMITRPMDQSPAGPEQHPFIQSQPQEFIQQVKGLAVSPTTRT